MNEKLVLLDGATGTRLWELASEQGLKKASVWSYNLTCPEIVVRVGEEYAAAGSKILCANTFSANGMSVSRESDYTVDAVVRSGVELARAAAVKAGARVAVDVGPLTALLQPYGSLSAAEAAELFRAQISAGVSAGAELIFLETFMDLEMLKLAAAEARRFDVPLLCSMSFAKRRRTMMGNTVAQIVAELEPFAPDGIGINCSSGPVEAAEVLREYAQTTDRPLLFKPNAGAPVTAPDGTESAPYTAQTFAAEAKAVLPLVTYAGACCGSDASYIKALGALIGA